MRSRGEKALGGLSMKDGAWPSEAECDVPSSSEALASTTPFCLLSMGAGPEEFGVRMYDFKLEGR